MKNQDLLNQNLALADTPSTELRAGIKKFSKVIKYGCSLATLLIIGTKVSSQTFTTTAAGNYNNPATWSAGIVPPAGASVTIAHSVSLSSAVSSADKVTVVAGGTFTIDTTGALIASNGLTISGGTVINNGGTINVGTSGGGNKVLNLASGTLTISSGVVNVNGNIIMNTGNFNMRGGNLNIDPNSGVATTSVANNVDIFNLSSAVKSNVNGGTVTFVDPPYAGSGKSLAYTGSFGNSSWLGSNLILGGSTGVNSTVGAVNGFNIDTRATGASYLILGNVIVNGGVGVNRFVTGSTVANNGFDVGGTLTINKGSEARTFKGGAVLRLSGDIINYGTYCDLAGISFSSRTGPNTVPQRLKRFPGAVFINSLTIATATAHFTGFEFNNTAKPIAITVTNGSEDPADRTAGVIVSGHVAFINGIVDIGQYVNQIQFTKTATISGVNGGLLRNGIAQLCKRFPVGASSFTYYVADSVNNYEVTPITINLTSNNLDNRLISVNVEGRAHPKLNVDGKQSNYINRYWRIFATPGGTFSATATFNDVPQDVVGSASMLQLSRWNGTAWSKINAVKGTNSFTISINQSTWTDGTCNEITARSAVNSATARTTTNSQSVSMPGNNNLNTAKISVYPNPVRGNNVNLTLTSVPVGKYNIGVYNKEGVKICNADFTHTSSENAKIINLPANLSSGIYTLAINNGSKIISQQQLLLAK